MKKTRTFHIALLLLAGMVIGALGVSQLNWLPSTKAELSSTPEPAAATAEVPATEKPAAATTYDSNIIKGLNNAFIAIAEKVQPSVVTVFTNKVIKSTNRDRYHNFFGDDIFDWFFRNPGQRGERHQRGQGSGVIVSGNGYILTNNHVVREADEIEVMLYNGKRVKAEVIGTDPKTDIAVIKVKENGLRAMQFGNSDKLRVGEWVMAIGSPLSENLASTVTAGIVSAKGRSYVNLADYEDFIQTDAAINPGNSGGALVNLNGELVGINTAIVSQNGGFQGIGFAVPVKMAREIMDALIRDGRVIRSWIGVNIQNVDQKIAEMMKLPSTKGAMVTDVVKDSPAERAGLRVEDVIVKLNGEEIRDTAHLRNTISLMHPGTRVELTIIRDGKSKVVTAKLDEYPENEQIAERDSGARRPEAKIGIEVETLSRRFAYEYNIDPDEEGVVIVDIDRNSSAYAEGLRTGDLILSVNRKRVRSKSEFIAIVAELKSGDQILVYALRGKARFFRAFEIE